MEIFDEIFLERGWEEGGGGGGKDLVVEKISGDIICDQKKGNNKPHHMKRSCDSNGKY